jgi:ATP-dependent RNA helicase DHX8/PRP22
MLLFILTTVENLWIPWKGKCIVRGHKWDYTVQHFNTWYGRYRGEKKNMDDIAKLQYLSLVSKICTELENHIGINYKALAEFIIFLAEENNTFETFKDILVKNGGEFSDSFIENLLCIIQLMKTKPKKESSLQPRNEKDKFAKEIKKEKKKSEEDDIVNDAMSKLEALPPSQIHTSKAKQGPSSYSRSECVTSVPVGAADTSRKRKRRRSYSKERDDDSETQSRNAKEIKKEKKKSEEDDIVNDAMTKLEALAQSQIRTSKAKRGAGSYSRSECETSVPVGAADTSRKRKRRRSYSKERDNDSEMKKERRSRRRDPEGKNRSRSREKVRERSRNHDKNRDKMSRSRERTRDKTMRNCSTSRERNRRQERREKRNRRGTEDRREERKGTGVMTRKGEEGQEIRALVPVMTEGNAAQEVESGMRCFEMEPESSWQLLNLRPGRSTQGR